MQDLIDTTSLIDAYDSALALLAERDATIAQLESAIEKREIWLTEESATIAGLRAQLAQAHEAIGAARALLTQIDASGNYPHSSTAIGAMLIILRKATQ